MRSRLPDMSPLQSTAPAPPFKAACAIANVVKRKSPQTCSQAQPSFLTYHWERHQRYFARQVEADAQKLRFFDRVKGRVFQHPASINFHSGRFESGWLVYTDLIETSKVRLPACTVQTH